jgi:hypothetical protein
MKCGAPDMGPSTSDMDSPCCHEFVKEILDRMWEQNYSVISQNCSKFSLATKAEISHTVASECMKNAMTEEQIKVALANHLSKYMYTQSCN